MTVYMKLQWFKDQQGTRILRAEVPGYGAVAAGDPDVMESRTKFDRHPWERMLNGLASGARRKP